MDGCVLLTSTPSCVVSPRGETTHSGVDVNNTHPSMINPLIVFMGGQTIQPRDPVAIALESFCSVIAMTALLWGDSSGHQSETASDAESVSMS